MHARIASSSLKIQRIKVETLRLDYSDPICTMLTKILGRRTRASTVNTHHVSNTQRTRNFSLWKPERTHWAGALKSCERSKAPVQLAGSSARTVQRPSPARPGQARPTERQTAYTLLLSGPSSSRSTTYPTYNIHHGAQLVQPGSQGRRRKVWYVSLRLDCITATTRYPPHCIRRWGPIWEDGAWGGKEGRNITWSRHDDSYPFRLD